MRNDPPKAYSGGDYRIYEKNGQMIPKGFNASFDEEEKKEASAPPQNVSNVNKENSVDSKCLILSAFYSEEKTKQFIETKNIDKDEWNAKYFPVLFAADEADRYCQQHIETVAFQSKSIMRTIALAFKQPPPPFKKEGSKYWSFKYILNYNKAWREKHSHDCVSFHSYDMSASELLFSWFRTWMLDYRLGAMYVKRAKIVRGNYQLRESPGIYEIARVSYPAPEIQKMDDALLYLHEWMKKFAKQRHMTQSTNYAKAVCNDNDDQ